jgi:hypothetical protein
MGRRMKNTPTPDDREHSQHLLALPRTQAAKKKMCAEFKFWSMRSRGWHFTRFEARVTKREHIGILAVLAAVVYLVASWLTKH